mgnify:CR=1 FL=1
MELYEDKLIKDYGNDFLKNFGGLKGRLDAVIIDYKTHADKKNGVASYNEL